jgi:hypothetical protein
VVSKTGGTPPTWASAPAFKSISNIGGSSAAVDPTGSNIAISETTTLSIGNARDVVYVLRTDDGADVFRRYLPRYSRSEVVFFDGGFLGYSDLEGTHILKIPTQ